MNNNDLSLINKYTVDELSLEDVFVFSVVLCDNEIDRDNERFSINTLSQLKDMYIGKTGIFDHDNKTKNQVARIFKAELLKDEAKKTKAGEVYHYIKAKAYIIKCSENTKLIKEIASGIKKEVSVGCSVEKILCSKCGKNLKNSSCEHSLDEGFHKILDTAKDAYEWSFVAVPAQVNAGVTKLYGGYQDLNDNDDMLLKLYKNDSLSEEESKQIYSYISELKMLAKDGLKYRDELINQVVKESYLSKSSMDSTMVKNIALKLSIDELVEFKKSFLQKKVSMQLGEGFKENDFNNLENSNYKIKI